MSHVFPFLVVAAVSGAWISSAPGASAAPAAPAPAAPSDPPRVRVGSPREPGTPLVLFVALIDGISRKPVPDAEVFVYQTDHAGYYDRGPEGNERGPRGARLHGAGRTNAAGALVFDTIVPGSYPNSGIFRHIHYRISAPGYRTAHQEIILDEAPRPSEEQKRGAKQNGDTVARRVKGKDGRYELRVTLTLQPGTES